ncbi:D-alanine--D-alanine ligase family protein [Peptoniphilus sp. oral taxon 386]|uniref:D-alanine--D-alanine ligase family protein n=1 Tax=Peptoniphilus sp. oral taxon 386 TaxID=652713 RepID=UPI0001DA9ED5|nr:D-alanine--D-alanine ligase family protein [Peptoniphilus sp. oral taxon 386]EFI41515.1 D-ala D-ala ligase N-terminal domain protein [Peptoniphilus sp. oral taxon 386 str. F0131]
MENIAVVFGGRSVEHEVSIITGMQIMENMDKSKYNPIPLYITKEGKFLTGDCLKNFSTFKKNDFSEAIEVFFKGYTGDSNMYTIKIQKSGLFSKENFGIEVYAKIDAVFPALHGTYGEDGCFQGLLELIQVPYVGCGVMSAAVGMDKVVMKKVFQSENIPMTEYFYFYRDEWKNRDEIIEKAEKLGYSLFVKPANLGSSVGISKATNREEFVEAVEIAVHYDRKIIVERAVENPREINAAVMGYEGDIIVSACEEPIGWKDLLKYEDKYIAGSKGSKGMKNKKKNLPADIPEDVRAEIEKYAHLAFRAIDGMGDARIDFLLDGDKVYVNEINTLPGSIAFYLWEESGISFKELITRLIELSKIRYKQKSENITSYNSDLLTKTSYGAKL